MSRVKRVGVFLLALGLILNIVFSGFLYLSVAESNERVDQIDEDIEVVKDYLLQAGEGNDRSGGEFSSVERQTGHMVAYDTQDDAGVVFSYNYQPLPSDAIYVDASDVTIESGFQRSMQNAQTAVGNTEYEPQSSGMALTFETPAHWEYVDGESAGLALAAHIASTDPDYRLNDSVILTGQVEESGSVVSVDYVTEKAEASREEGKDVLIAPHTYGPVNVDGIEVIHVQSVDEALEHALEPVEE